MATKENDENQDINENSEKDFGLPDLEFEELDHLDEEEESINEEDELADLITSDSEEESDLEEIESADSVDTVLEDPEITDDLDSLSDIGSDSDYSNNNELDKVGEVTSEVFLDDIVQETVDDSDTVELDNDLMASFGEEDEVSPPAIASTSGGSSQSFTRIIIIGLAGAVAMAFIFLYMHNQNLSSGEDMVTEVTETEGTEESSVDGAETTETGESTGEESEPATATSNAFPDATTPSESPASTETKQQAAPTPRPTRTQPAATSTPGQVTTITSATGRYYIIVASFIDDDMANDHGKKLAGQGASVKIINPFGDRKFWRVSVADYGILREAVNGTNQLKPQYGDDIWAVKY
ncbi:MAG: hypothetical protein O2887_12980 [Bacteroidetes bacterium]|nr:hypothetical protein [Bacteroidota bacterium]MDA1121383.1 hypothetical protein [Bacteroidota bacterium]